MSTQFASTGDSRFVFAPGEAGYGFHLEVRAEDGWAPVTAIGNALVSGPSFDLRPDSVVTAGDGIRFTGTNSGTGSDSASNSDSDRTWTGSVTPVPDSTWYHVSVEFDSAGFPIGEHGAIEPQIAIDLGALPPYERGDHVWFKTLVENPTQWNNEGRGNDFPALCYYDPYLKTRFRMFFDITAMSWMGPETIARFYSYWCGFRRTFHGQPTAEIGLLSSSQSGHAFPAGRQVFSWYVSADPFDPTPTPPSEQEALNDLVAACLPLLRPSAGYWPERATSWADFARGCADDLMDSEHCWGRDENGEYLLSYVDGRSDAWEATLHARGLEQNGDTPCLEAALWALQPIVSLQSAVPGVPFGELGDRLERFIRSAVTGEHSSTLSGVSAEAHPVGSWQYVYMLAEIWYLFCDGDDRDLVDAVRREIDTVAVPVAVNTDHLFPLQFDKHSLGKIGPGSNFAVAGPYALLMLSVHEKTGEERYLEEARQALRALANVQIDAALQEVVLIAQAADAAARLGELTGEPEWEEYRRYFRDQTLRMMYWYDDRTSARTAQSSHLGMFLACANIGYPAFFENIETDARLAASLRFDELTTETLQVLDYGRRTNFSFFPQCSPEMFGPMPVQYIPFEDVPILEGPDAGFLGQEIYGAGFTFRAHLLWDALATAKDRELMVLNLDPYGTDTKAGSWGGRFVVFNGGHEPIATSLVFPVLGQGDEGHVTLTSRDGATTQYTVQHGGEVPVRLGGMEWQQMSLTVSRGGA